MAKRMLIDSTHPEETRVAVISGNRLEEFDFESARKKQIKGNVYLAKVTRVEPSLQACFVEYGGNRHGFLAFNEIHPDYYRIPVADREALNRMVAEAMAAQEDDEEQEERRPRWRRRGRGRRNRGGASDAARGASNTGDDFADGDTPPGATDGDPSDENGADTAAGQHGADDEARNDDEPLRAEANPIDGDRDTSIDTPAGAPEPRDAVPLEMAPPDRVTSEPLGRGPGDDSQRAQTDEARDDVAAGSAPQRYSSEDAPTEPPQFEGELAPRGEDTDAYGSEARIEHSQNDGELPGGEGETARNGDSGETPVAEESVETVGGDEVEDIRRKHRIWQRRYKIQEVIRKRQILLVQVAKEERGNKGAALTTYISLAGRYCVLMPNTPRGGGISRKITSHADRKRLKEIVGEMEVPDGMAVIVRTAGMERSKPELRRDLDFLLKTWDGIREKALDSTAPALIYEEANLIKRAVRDLYTSEVEEIIVDGDEGHEAARSFMSLLMPSHVKKVVHYADRLVPLFHRYQVESQIDNMHSPSVQLRSGGYIVLNPTEALVAIDVNSGRSTRERNIEETATRTNLEAADEVARQLRLRDLAGLIVIDFIDMEEGRNRHHVERRLKEALKNDRARIQVGRISPFGLLEMSRQRLRPSLVEAAMMPCPHCGGAGHVRSTESMALTVLRAVEEEGLRQRSAEVTVGIPAAVALYIFNHKRQALGEIEKRHGFRVVFQPDESVGLSTYRILRSAPKTADTREDRDEPGSGAEDRAQDDRAREDRPREDRPRDDRGRERRGRDDRGRHDRARDDRGRDGRRPQHDDPGAEPSPEAAHDTRRDGDDVTDQRPHGEAEPIIAADESGALPIRDADAGEGEDREAGGEERREGEGPRGAEGERRGRRRGRRGGRRRRGRNREGEETTPENFAERPHESTLGPFGEDDAGAPAPGAEANPAPTDGNGHAEEIPAQRTHTTESRAEASHADEPTEPPRWRAETERREPEPVPYEAPVNAARAEPPAEAEAPPAEAARAEPAAERPRAPEPPPPPPEPAAPPKRGWWNLRRG